MSSDDELACTNANYTDLLAAPSTIFATIMPGGDDFGNRMKAYEMAEAAHRLDPELPFVARLDGNSFSKFTRGLVKPFDERLSQLMVETTRHLMATSGALVGYTQSDEISLVFPAPKEGTTRYFDGRVHKLTSILAASASAYFVRHLDAAIPEKAGATPVFDCRVWALPTAIEAANAVVWRVHDAERNSVALAAHFVFGHRALQGASKSSMRAMLQETDKPWEAYPPAFKWGTLLHRVAVKRRFTEDELAALPERHHARNDPTMVFERSELQKVRLESRPTMKDLLCLIEAQ